MRKLEDLQKDSYIIIFNLRKGYHHIEIRPDHFNGGFWGLYGNFQGELPSDILCLQLLLLVCLLHLTFFAKNFKPFNKYWRFNGVDIAFFLAVIATNIWLDLKEVSVYQQ